MYSSKLNVPIDENNPSIDFNDNDDDHAKSASLSGSPRFNHHSTLEKRQQSWVDPLEPRIQDTFYHKNLDTLRPRYSLLLKHGSTVDAMFNVDNPQFDREEDKELDRHESASRISRTPSWETEDAELQKKINKFGTLKGVTSRCLLNIFGVIMFLRMGWMVGQSGTLLSIVIILLCSSVTFITTLSMSAIATNGRIEGGGLYYMISRSLGPSFGGTVGLLFGVGNAIATSMYLIGFAEVIVVIFDDDFFTGNRLMDIRIISNLALLVETVLALLGGMKLVMRSSMILLLFIICVIALIYIGSMYQTDMDTEGEGLIGLQGFTNGNFADNFWSEFSESDGVTYDFFKVLAIFFPACTGIMAGANISSQLKNPSTNIPSGTLSAIGITTTVYITLVIVLGAIVTRVRLIEDSLILQSVSVWGPLFLGGVFAATLSAAMTSLTSSPSILRAVIQDEIVPVLSVLGGNEKKTMLVSVLIVFSCNLLGSLNMVAPLITDFYLIAYCVINLSCFVSSMSKSPGWRPSFKWFNKYLALLGSVLCIMFMILSDWMYAIIALFIAFILFQYIAHISPDVNWGKVQESRQYYDAFRAVLKLDKGVESNTAGLHVKHWRPSFLFLIGDPLHRPHLIHFANTLSKSYAPSFFGNIRTDKLIFRTKIDKFHQQNYGNYLPRRLLNSDQKGFFESVFASSFREGTTMLMQCTGLGTLRPNTLVLGYHHNWKLHMKKSYEYIEVIRDALEMGYAIMLLRNFSYIDWTKSKYQQNGTRFGVTETSKLSQPAGVQMENVQLNDDNQDIKVNDVDIEIAVNVDDAKEDEYELKEQVDQPQDTTVTEKWWMKPLRKVIRRNSQQLSSQSTESSDAKMDIDETSFIDVWWLIDDGGLTVLLPYLMKLHSFWSGSKLRLNIISDSNVLSSEYLDVIHLMNEFRLPFEKPNLIEVSAENEAPKQRTLQRFHELTDNQVDFERDLLRPRVISKWLKVAELIHEHSSKSRIIVMTLPLPTRFYKYPDDEDIEVFDPGHGRRMNGKVYLSILEMLTENLPPSILVRGNGHSALTFYSE